MVSLAALWYSLAWIAANYHMSAGGGRPESLKMVEESIWKEIQEIRMTRITILERIIFSAEGDVFVYSDAEITMEHAATSSIESGLCSAPGLRFGTKVMLLGDVVFTQGATLTVETVVIEDDVEVEEEGSLTATTVHITADGELDSDGNVQITDALVLEGDGLEGSLAAGSTVSNLTYATVDSDEIDLGSTVARLSVNVGADRELRISEAVTVTDLGLCSGSLVLIDTDTEAKTLTVTDHLVVHGWLSESGFKQAGKCWHRCVETQCCGYGWIYSAVCDGQENVHGWHGVVRSS